MIASEDEFMSFKLLDFPVNTCLKVTGWNMIRLFI